MEKCVTVTAPDGTKFFKGACTNCRYVAHSHNCSFHENYEHQETLKMEEDGEAGEGNEDGKTRGGSNKGKGKTVSKTQNTGLNQKDDGEGGNGHEPTEEEMATAMTKIRKRRKARRRSDKKGQEESERESQGRKTKRNLKKSSARRMTNTGAGPDKNGGYRRFNWWYPETGGSPFWAGMPDKLRRERLEQEDNLINLETRMRERRGPRGDAKYGLNDHIEEYTWEYR
jgi:hypothetical protein